MLWVWGRHCRRLGLGITFLSSASAIASDASSLAASIDDDVVVAVGGDNLGNISPSSSATSARPKAHELDGTYTFEQYLVDFDKAYDRAEFKRRSQIFASNLNEILRHNEGRMDGEGRIGGGYLMGVNAFTDLGVEELPPGGYDKLSHPSWRAQLVLAGEGDASVSETERLLAGVDVEAYSKPPDFEVEDVSALPRTVDWSAEGKVNPIVPAQGHCGSCWTFAATAAIESQLAISTGEDPISLSQQNILECAPNPYQCDGRGTCKGSTAELALNYVADETAKKTGGMFTLEDLPYHSEPRRWAGRCEDITREKSATVGIEGWTRLPINSYKYTMNALAKIGPLAVAVSSHGWQSYERGVFDANHSSISHVVLLVGYGSDEETGEKFWKIRNSWGPDFGENGFIRIQRSDDDEKVCGKDKHPLHMKRCGHHKGRKVHLDPVTVCGTCAVLFDVSYPIGVHKIY